MTAEQIKDKLKDFKEQSTCRSLKLALVSYANLTQDQAIFAIQNPKAIFFDELLQQVHTLDDDDGLALFKCLVGINHPVDLDPMDILTGKMWAFSKKNCWIWRLVLEKQKKQVYSLSQLQSIFEHLPPDYYDCKITLETQDDWLKLQTQEREEHHKRGQIKSQDVEAKEAQLLTRFDKETYRTYYYIINDISQKLEQQPASIYTHCPALCMYPALILSGKQNVVLFCLSTGRGKSWVNILLSIYYESIGLKPHILVLNGALRQQYLDQLAAVGIKDSFKVI